MAPVILEAKKRSDTFETIVCVTGQHREMFDHVNQYFQIVPDIDLQLMQPNQTLASLTSRCLTELDSTIAETNPAFVLAQGDTTTVLAASLATFYHKISFVHVEAGLRSGTRLVRQLVSGPLANFIFASLCDFLCFLRQH
jgi:UDP-N-acetylglucosamine 2-epimerase (non-hydrolysing)